MIRKPALLAIDFRISRAVRYVPKITGGFFTETAQIGEELGQPSQALWGGDEALEILECFRAGKHHERKATNMEDQPSEYA